MTIKSGYFKKHLHVDLSQGKAERLDLEDEFLEKYIGAEVLELNWSGTT